MNPDLFSTRPNYRWIAVIAGVIVVFALLAWPKVVKAETLIPHPQGCPRIAFCGCGAAVEIFGQPIRSLWLARAWFKFPKAQPARNTVGVKNHHVVVLKEHVRGKVWIVADYNSGGHKSRLRQRSIAGFVIVDPHSRLAMGTTAALGTSLVIGDSR
jgi:hypothetical protein